MNPYSKFKNKIKYLISLVIYKVHNNTNLYSRIRNIVMIEVYLYLQYQLNY